MDVSQKPLIISMVPRFYHCIGLTITIFHKKFIGEWLENLKTKKVFTKFLQRGFNLLEVSLDAFFIQLRSVNRRSVIEKNKVGFSFPAPKAECMHSGGAQGKMKGIQ